MPLFFSAFLSHLFNYTVALIDVGRYFRIKYHVSFKSMWTKRMASRSICIMFFLSLLQSVMVTTGLIIGREDTVMPFYVFVDSIVIGTITLLQLKTIQKSHSRLNQSIVVASCRIDKKISKLSIQIMVALCILVTSHLILYIVLEIIQERLNKYAKSIVEFSSFMSLMLIYANSFVNAVLFLITNVKARRLARNFGR